MIFAQVRWDVCRPRDRDSISLLATRCYCVRPWPHCWVGRAAQPNFLLATASWVAWPARLKAVLDVLTLVHALNTLNEVKRQFGDDKKWQDAWNMNGKLRQEYDKCIARPDDCGVSS